MRNATVKAIIAAILIPASAGAVRADETTFTVVERATTNTIVDVGSPGDSEGDVLTFHNDLFDAENRSRSAATTAGASARSRAKSGNACGPASLPADRSPSRDHSSITATRLTPSPAAPAPMPMSAAR